jgi:hypothetical protein
MRLLALLSAAVALALSAAPASAATKVKTVDAEVVFKNGNRPGDPGNCSAITFVQWRDVPGTVSAKVIWTRDDSEHSMSKEAPFDDVYTWVATYTVQPGYHWISIGKSWVDGFPVNDCSALRDRIRAAYDTTAAKAELTVEVDPKVCNAAKKAAAARRKSVSSLQKQLNAATSAKAKKRLRAKLTTAKSKRAKAIKRVKSVC